MKMSSVASVLSLLKDVKTRRMGILAIAQERTIPSKLEFLHVYLRIQLDNDLYGVSPSFRSLILLVSDIMGTKSRCQRQRDQRAKAMELSATDTSSRSTPGTDSLRSRRQGTGLYRRGWWRQDVSVPAKYAIETIHTDIEPGRRLRCGKIGTRV